MALAQRLGLAVPWGSLPELGDGWTQSDVIALAKEADRLGYDSVWVPEAWGPDAFTLLGYLAAQTTHIRLATGIVNVFSRSPGILAQSAAGLDELSNGRAILGLGASGPQVIEGWHGVSFDRPLRRTRECVEIVRLALSGKRVDYAGELFQLQRFRLATSSPPRADIPIFIAGFGPRNLEMIGQIADGWLPIFVSPTTLPDQVEQVVGAARAAGRDPAQIEIAPFTLLSVCADDASVANDLIADSGVASDATVSAGLPTRATAEALLRRHLAFYIGGMGTFYYDLAVRLGFAVEAETLAAAWKAGPGQRQEAMEAMPPAMLRALTVCGTATECLAQLGDLRRAGATLPIVTCPLGTSVEHARASLAALAV